MPTIEGGCLCGAVRYRSDAEPVMQVVCHCETCRKNSGSAFSMNVAVPGQAPHRERAVRAFPGGAARAARRSTGSYLGDCGSHIYSHGPAYQRDRVH